MKFFKRLPPVSLEAAGEALKQTLPPALQKELERQEQEADQLAIEMSEDMIAQLAGWQREAIVAVIGEAVVNAADLGDLDAKIQIRKLGFFLKCKKKPIQGGGWGLVYTMWRTLPESKRTVEIGVLKFVLDRDGNLEKE